MSELRRTGIDVLGDVSWGKHICVFYQSKEDFLNLLLPFFKAGLENNERCVWALPEEVEVKEVEKLLRKEVEQFDKCLERDQLTLLNELEAYKKSGSFKPRELLHYWSEEIAMARKNGFDGMRATGSGNWADLSTWKLLCDYERDANKVISEKNIIAICAYALDRVGLLEIMSVGIHHEIIISRKEERFTAFAPTSYESILEHFRQSGSYPS